ncbi:hypothetical protein FN846DRAFT_1012375 [Sphaerosporella brunnea]|uniref:Uncharacterized protein n=1 Tax=Sphaerosporella brunnea TaxID=1250544 RepID=A0A5J5EYY3_9PEZI|nr:hypothetical protein FN846DRAFT_1012375 [Sphaerosporella brunnea]
MASWTQKDLQAQKLLEQDDVAAAPPEQIYYLRDRVAAARTTAQEHSMTLYYYVCVRSAFVHVGLIDDATYTFDGPMTCDMQPVTLVAQPDMQLLSDTIATLRKCAVFKAAVVSINSRRPPRIVFDHRRMVEVSCALVAWPRVAPLQPQPLQLRWCTIGLGYDEKKYTNALLQLLFCVPTLRRLLPVDQPRPIEVRSQLAALDAARDTVALAQLQRNLLHLFADCCDAVPDVLVGMQCADTVRRKTTTWCALHKGYEIASEAQMVLKCDVPVHQAIADAQEESETSSNGHCARCNDTTTRTVTIKHIFNLQDGILLVQPSPAYPVTELDEEYGEWDLCGGILADGRAFFRDGDHFYQYHPQQRLPCAFITPLTGYSVEDYCANQTVHILFYICTGVADGLHDCVENQAQQLPFGHLGLAIPEPGPARDIEPLRQLEQQPVHEIEPLRQQQQQPVHEIEPLRQHEQQQAHEIEPLRQGRMLESELREEMIGAQTKPMLRLQRRRAVFKDYLRKFRARLFKQSGRAADDADPGV